MNDLFLEVVLKVCDDCDMLGFGSNFCYFFLCCDDIFCGFYVDVFNWLMFNGDFWLNFFGIYLFDFVEFFYDEIGEFGLVFFFFWI